MRNTLVTIWSTILISCLLSPYSYAQQASDSLPEQLPKVQLQDSLTINDFVKINKIIIKGNKKTKRRIITREIDIEPGDIYSREDLKKLIKLDENKIFNTSLFTSVTGELETVEPGLANLIFFVKERWYIWPSVYFNIADRNFSDWLFNQKASTDRFEYGVRFDQYNVRGLNEKLSLLARFGFERRFGFSYKIPYLNKAQTLGLSYYISFTENNNVPIETRNNRQIFIDSEDLFADVPDKDKFSILRNRISTGLSFTYRESFYNRHTFGAIYDRSYVVDTVLNRNPDYIAGDDNTQNYISLFYDFRRDFRDRNNYPLKGFLVQAGIQKDGLGIFGDMDFTQIDMQLARYIPLSEKFYYATSFAGFTSFPQKQPYQYLQGLGYGNVLLKGYETYLIQGQHFALNKNELKYKFFDIEVNLGNLMPLEQFRTIPFAAYFKIFFDQGYVQNNANRLYNERFTNNYLYSTGVGLDMVTYYDAVLRLEYSVNSAGEFWFNLDVKAGI
jgi:outer membrane protein assembly factor BamA